jgi:hypothetical protein
VADGQPQPDRPTFRLTLRAERGWTAPPVVRLRRLAKALLRAYGFRLLEVRELAADGTADRERDTA